MHTSLGSQNIRRNDNAVSLFAVVLLFLVLPFQRSHAQTLVPFDHEGNIFILSAAFETEHKFFGVEGLFDARIILRSDSSLILSLTISRAGGGYALTERMLTRSDLSDIRQKYASIRHRSGGASVAESSGAGDGSTMFVQTFAGLGLSWYGLTIPAVISLEGPGAIGSYLLTAAGCYFFADGYARGRTVSAAQGIAFQYFATRGIAHGYALSGIAMGNGLNHRIAIPVATAASLAEGFVMMALAERQGWSEGYMSSIGIHGDAGLLFGLGMGYALGSGVNDYFTDIETNTGRYSLTFLTGGIAGLLIGGYAGSHIDYTAGDALIQESIGYLGAFTSFALGDIAGVKSRKGEVLTVSLGLLGGHALGSMVAASTQIDADGARRAQLLASGGIILGLGIAYMVSPEDADRTLYLSLATLGGIGGLAYGLGRLEDKQDGMLGAGIRFHPEGILMPVYRSPETGRTKLHPMVSLVFSH